MPHQFSDDEKEVKEFSDGNWLGFGVHKVKIGMIERGETESGKEYIEVTVLGENEEEDTARVWFTSDKAANYSFNVLRQIYVHNAPEDKKDAARSTFDAVKDTEEVVKLYNEKLIGGECWFTKYPDPERTYTNANGEIKQSINKNIMGYEPKLRTDLLPENNQHPLSGATKANDGDEAAKGIPSNW